MSRIFALLFFAALLGGVIGVTYALLTPPKAKISTGSDAAAYTLRLANQPELEKFLAGRGFWEWKNQFTNNNKVKKLLVQFTDKAQELNKEVTKEGKTIGSVGVIYKNGTLTLLIHSDPSIWKEEDKDWHLEAQLLRFINGHSKTELKLDEKKMFQQYVNNKPYFFELNEK